MAENNPLQQYFRQPKIFVDLPSKGIYNKPGSLNKHSNLAVYGLTGMDEIILKTPDALLSGEAITRTVKSCCPDITDPYELPSMDIEMLVVAIRVATYGNSISLTHTCKKCQSENDYDADLGIILEHYKHASFSNKIKEDEIVINVRPLSYKESNKFNIETFNLQRRLFQINNVPEADQEGFLREIYESLGVIQTNMMFESIESIELPDTVVVKREFIKEFVEKCDRAVFQSLKTQFENNIKNMKYPDIDIVCSSCDTADKILLELNQTNFFVGA